MNAWERRSSRRLGRRDRAPIRVQATGPIHLYEWPAGEKLPRRSVQNVKEPVSIAPEYQLPRTPVPIHIRENGNLHRVIIVRVVWGELEIPLQLSGVGLKRQDAIGIEIVAGPLPWIPIRTRIAGTPIGQV